MKYPFPYARGAKPLCTLLAALCFSFCITADAPADTQKAEPEQSTLYGIGSTSKVVTTAAVLKLADEGLLDLDAPVVRYIPDFYMPDPRYTSITPRMLLDHTSGLQGSSLANSMLLGDSDTYNHDHLLDSLKTQRLKAEPGSFATYCNDGFTLAEILVERITQTSFTQYLDDTFAKPLNLTGFLTPQSQFDKNRLAKIYDSKTGIELPTEHPNVIGSGGIFSSASDLCRFSQIYMESPGQASQILSPAAAQSMAYSHYLETIKGEGRDSTLSYGLGWDSVDTYPFNQYGIRALSKGGDTSNYHSSLIVLPKENISCAVLSSGGSSSFNQMAAQEILLAYLEETGRIQKETQIKKENPLSTDGSSQTVPMPNELTEFSGYYSGKDLYQVAVADDGQLILSDLCSSAKQTHTYTYQPDGSFLSSKGQYIDTSGTMASSGNGQLGQTSLSFQTNENGDIYLMAQTYELFPSLSQTALYLPIAQKLSQFQTPSEDVMAAWQKRDGREYYLVSDKYTSTAYLNTAVTKLKVMEAPAGYLAFQQAGFSPAVLTDEYHARFYLQVPGQIGRDLSDYEIYEKNGRTYLNTGSFRLISEDCVLPLPETSLTVTIPEDGETQWFVCGQEFFGSEISITFPDTGSFFIYEHRSRDTVCIQSSYTIQSGRPFALPADGRLAFAGLPGTTFQVQIGQSKQDVSEVPH